MPPSQEEAPPAREDTTEALFDLQISSSGPTSGHNSPSITPAVNNPKAINNVTFLALALEIRLKIYDLLLVSRQTRKRSPSSTITSTYPKVVHPFALRTPRHFKTLETAILRTCKQSYCEANPILYSRNIFAFDEPEQMLRLIEQIGRVNLRLVRTLKIYLPSRSDLASSLRLFGILAQDATGLRSIELRWDANCVFDGGREERGLGDNLDFVRMLGKIQGLEKLNISGYYAMNWPAYLERTMSVLVSVPERCPSGNFLKEGDLTVEDLKDQEFVRKFNHQELERLEKYQRGTEDLVP